MPAKITPTRTPWPAAARAALFAAIAAGAALMTQCALAAEPTAAEVARLQAETRAMRLEARDLRKAARDARRAQDLDKARAAHAKAAADLAKLRPPVRQN